MEFTEKSKQLKEVFMHPEQIKVTPKQVIIGVLAFLFFSIILAVILPSEDNSTTPSQSKDTEQSAEKWTQEDIKEADDFIITMEATGLVKERKGTCSDGSKGCYYFLIDENLWTNSTTYEVKQQLLTASEIYASSQNPYKFFKGIGYMSGKTMYDIWGIK